MKNEVTLTEDDLKAVEEIAQSVGEHLSECLNVVYEDGETDEDYELADAKREVLQKEVIKSLMAAFGMN